MTMRMLALAFLLLGCSDLAEEPKIYAGGRFDVQYHGGPGAKMVYLIKDKKTACEFVTFQTIGEGAAMALIPGTCNQSLEVTSK